MHLVITKLITNFVTAFDQNFVPASMLGRSRKLERSVTPAAVETRLLPFMALGSSSVVLGSSSVALGSSWVALGALERVLWPLQQ